MSDKKTDSTEETQQKLLGEAKRGRVTRREFMQYAGALGLSAAAATTLWSHRANAAPKRGGNLRIGTEAGSNTDTLDPRFAIGSNQLTCCVLSVYDTLVGIGTDGGPAPMLAESWEASADAKTWRFKLRKGVEFQNGKTMDVNDVLSSLAYVDNDANTHGDSRTIVGSMEERKADGDYVVIKLKTPNADLPILLAAYGLLIAPAGTEGKQWDQPGLGTGPYSLVDFNPGVRSSVKRHPNFYRDDEGFFDSAEFLNIQDQSARSNAIRTDVVDVVNRPDPKTVHLLAKVPGINIIETEGTQHYTMPMRCDLDPFTNLDVRTAMKYAVDREELLKKILGGYGYVGNDHPIGRKQLYFNKDLPQISVDLDKAKFHLKKAGLSKLDVELNAADTAWVGSVDAAQLVQETAKNAGINIKVNRVAEDGYWSNTWMQVPWCLSYWSGRATEDWMFSAGYSAESSWNESFWKNDRFNQLLVAARGELDHEKRRVMYYEMQELVHTDGGALTPLFSNLLLAANDKLGYGTLRGNYDLDNFQLARTGWFKS